MKKINRNRLTDIGCVRGEWDGQVSKIAVAFSYKISESWG